MRVLSAQQMQEVDQRAITDLGIPGCVLMENAAMGIADALGEAYPTASRITVLCGPGNNGGDGLALVRHLEGRGYRCRTFLFLGRSAGQGDAALQLEILRRCGLEVEELTPEADLQPVFAACLKADLIVDSLFGTGLERPLKGHLAALVVGLQDCPVPLLAVDLPSGMDASREQPIGPHLVAERTVTFAAPKVAHVLSPAREACGELVVTDLGLPPGWVESAGGSLHLLTAGELAGYLSPRPLAGHKGNFGHLLLVAGSAGKAGAAVLAARAAMRSGVGLVTTAVPAGLLDVVDGGSLESMTLAVAETAEGGLAKAAAETLLDAAAGKSAVAVGPGLGSGRETQHVIRRLAEEVDLPLLLDADGLNAFAGRLAELARRSAPTVLTPHPGELARLLGTTSRSVQADRRQAVARAAESSSAVVALKGHQTLVATPSGEIFINPTGNPGMATGGSGDVLTGLLAALLAQRWEALAAAQLGVFLHGLAGDLAARETGYEALTASDLVAFLAPAWRVLSDA